MPDRYVNPAVGSSGAGTSWAAAYKTLKEATDAAAAGETIYFANGTPDPLAAATVYTLAAGVRVISTSDTTNNPPTTFATGATISTTTNAHNATFDGYGALYGLTITLGDSADANDIVFGAADAYIVCEDCSFVLGGNSGNSELILGASSTGVESCAEFYRCTFTWGATTQGITGYSPSRVLFVDCDMSAGATHPATLFEVVQGLSVEMIGCDLSDISTIVEASPAKGITATLRQCKLKDQANSTLWAPSQSGMGHVWAFDCASGDTHILMAHVDYYGSTTISTSIYANDHIGDSALSWVVAGTANATRATPYRSPWLSVYHTGTSQITPYLECVRSGSSTAYTEAQVWSEWTAKATSGSSRVDFYTNQTAPLATPGNNESSSKTGSDWTGENATSWFGKLQPNTSITPAEAGHISARVCVGGEHTVYVDPQIRGLS